MSLRSSSSDWVVPLRERDASRYVPGQQLYLSQVQPERLASIVVDK